jgi:hypothetical protein
MPAPLPGIFAFEDPLSNSAQTEGLVEVRWGHKHRCERTGSFSGHTALIRS